MISATPNFASAVDVVFQVPRTAIVVDLAAVIHERIISIERANKVIRTGLF